MNFENTLHFAQQLDRDDPLAPMRQAFHLPQQSNGEDEIYLCGNSLGCQPKRTTDYVNEALTQWQRYAVKGHFTGQYPWMPYHEFLTEGMAELVGAKTSEVVTMNSLTTNLHLMMVSFYNPTATRYKILIEDHAFPSDHYAVESQLKFHGYHPDEALILVKPEPGEELIREQALFELIEREGDQIALILLPGVHYYTGQVFDIATITAAGHAKGCRVGFDLAHAAGNIPMQLHQWQVDFACWCTYKYLNSGPGSVAGCFVHEQHHTDHTLPRFTGWWGHDKSTRFKMENHFVPIESAEAWQLSNPPILSLAAIRASLDTFAAAGGIEVLRKKSCLLTDYLQYLLTDQLNTSVQIITPTDTDARGCQLSLTIDTDQQAGKAVFERLEQRGVTGDWRYPNVIRIAPVPLYNRFTDCYQFVNILAQALQP